MSPSDNEVEADTRESESNPIKADSKISPILVAVWTAAIAAIGNGMVSIFNGWQTHRLELEKAQSSVILEVVKTNSPDKAANNLAFLVDIGVITEEQTNKRLSTYLKTRTAGQGPSIPSNKDGLSGESAPVCATTGDYVVVNVHWGDSDGGLNVRTGPNQTQLGVIPTTGTNIDVGACRAGWCEVRYKCIAGWSFAKHLALRSTRTTRVNHVSDPAGLVVRRDPGAKGEPTGTIAADTTDIVKHVCQPAPLPTDDEWCQISTGRISGWVPSVNLEDEVKPAPQATSNASSDSSKTANATPADSAPPQPQ